MQWKNLKELKTKSAKSISNKMNANCQYGDICDKCKEPTQARRLKKLYAPARP
jgi:hypothetical protein